MMNAVCTVPGILKLFLSKSHASYAKRLFIFIMDFASVLMQCTVFGIVFASRFLSKSIKENGGHNIDAGGAIAVDNKMDDSGNSYDYLFNEEGNRDKRDIGSMIIEQTTKTLMSIVLNNNENSQIKQSIIRGRRDVSDYNDLFENNGVVNNIMPASHVNSSVSVIDFKEILASFQIEWELPISLMLVSLVWWENFIDRDIKCGSYKLVNMKLLKDNIAATRCKTTFISSLWKILVTLLFAYIFHPGIFNFEKVFPSTRDSVDNHFKYMNDMGMGGMGGMWGLAPNQPNMGGGGGGGPGGIGAFGPLPPPPVLSKRSVNELNETVTKSGSLLSEVLGINVNNNSDLNRQIRQVQAFTAAQMFIPSSVTLPNLVNMNDANGMNGMNGMGGMGGMNGMGGKQRPPGYY
jgi:hypothetical protein